MCVHVCIMCAYMYVYMFIGMYCVHVYIMCAYMYVYMFIDMYVCTCVYYVCIHVCICVYRYVCVYMYVCVYVCVHVCVCMCMCEQGLCLCTVCVPQDSKRMEALSCFKSVVLGMKCPVWSECVHGQRARVARARTCSPTVFKKHVSFYRKDPFLSRNRYFLVYKHASRRRNSSLCCESV